ncbi:uncharacterized protein EI90DRAFT_2918444 [Cantharellus anzutake]|uniref:uncharacterized protein n=1 Tax=Cantharellus anzutake TaxID=1750568 RepID=UPI001907849D|nr:uncharacterized protein EI90DRAFT_2918444 [Cantharellus anzutake]KAF8332415.1 hypothetical protein EI90DRAFT_2918444 [Cantharellus anzutake]
MAQERAKDLQDQIESENIVLADIQSEYEFSDEEGPPRHVNHPKWTYGDLLDNDLKAQGRLDPDGIFGSMGPLHMEQVFKPSRPNKFRQRTSSANWNSGDGLTQQEIVNYRIRMGYDKPERR